MKDELTEKFKNAPASPGVYVMKDRDGRIIYVGKANNLRNRVKAYLGGTDSRFMIPFLVSKVHDVEFIVTKTEKEALILENNLIKEHRPRYNVIFRDDKTYFNIRINLNDSFPRFHLIRRPKKDGARHFGPYPSSAAAKETLRFLQSIFPLRTCGDQQVKGRKRPCLEYEIRRCLAPCVGYIDEVSYQRLVSDSVAFMEGREKTLIVDLQARMDAASDQLCFEEAAALRDRIAAIKETLEKQRVVSMSFKDQDVFGIYREGNLTQICMLYVRKGKIIGKKDFPFFKIKSASPEILSSVLKQYYDSEVYIPDEIIISENIEDHAVMEEWLSDKKGKKVSLLIPKRGSGKELVHIAESNAKSMFEEEKHATDAGETLCKLAEVLKLKNIPGRIECFDISNIGGKYAVGSMVTFVDGRPWKAGYRRFRIRTIEGADDYAMMYEVLSRRYAKKDNLPDLIVVDGGKGQLGVTVTVMKDLHIERIDVIGLAKEGRGMAADKGEDRVYLVGKKNPVYISKWPDVLFLLQRVRDEAHRFAVTYYRKLKNKRDFESVLDNIPGIGVSKKIALLGYFGDIKKIREAPVEELQKAGGIGRQLAEKIYTFLKEQEGEKVE
ncbi:MAG TPA: excinuclease ABC subunit UvrC [Syntrophales bacterium]|nr:excinuclease ABC subunit UvrC [Syntrophales bacterium]